VQKGHCVAISRTGNLGKKAWTRLDDGQNPSLMLQDSPCTAESLNNGLLLSYERRDTQAPPPPRTQGPATTPVNKKNMPKQPPTARRTPTTKPINNGAAHSRPKIQVGLPEMDPNHAGKRARPLVMSSGSLRQDPPPPPATQAARDEPPEGRIENPTSTPIATGADLNLHRQPQRPPAPRPWEGCTANRVIHLFVAKEVVDEMVSDPEEKVEDCVSRIPNTSAEMDSILDELGPCITDFHSRCRGDSAAIGLLFSEMAKHPIPPQITDNLLGLDKQTLGTEPRQASARQFREALCKIHTPGESAAGYLRTLSRHITRMEMAFTTTRALHELLKTFHKASEGAVSALGPLLSDMGPAAIQGKPLPRGMTSALLRVRAKANTYELHELVTLFERYLSTEDSPASLTPILSKHIGMANKHPLTPPDGQSPEEVTDTEAQDSIDSGVPDTERPSPHLASWCTRETLEALKNTGEGSGQQMTDLLHKVFPGTDAAAATGAETCRSGTTWSVRRISESRLSIHIVLEVKTERELHDLLQVNSDSGQAFLETLAKDTNPAHLAVEKILIGPDCTQEVGVPVERQGGLNWSERLRSWLMERGEYEAIADIDEIWEDPSTTRPRRSWTAYWDFFTALGNNVPIWINKIRHRGLTMLAAQVML